MVVTGGAAARGRSAVTVIACSWVTRVLSGGLRVESAVLWAAAREAKQTTAAVRQRPRRMIQLVYREFILTRSVAVHRAQRLAPERASDASSRH